MAKIRHDIYLTVVAAALLVTQVKWTFTQAASLGFGCVWRSSISATLPEMQDIAARCREGRLLWYYPKGQLLTHFSTDTGRDEFTLCLKSSANNHIETIYLKSGQHVVKLKLPTPGNDTCVSSQDNKRDLLFISPTEKVHVSEIHYTITPT